MNSTLGKKILSLVRNGDFAHAGEEEATSLTFKYLPKNPNNRLLDVGCGRGGTANYLYAKGYGQVFGFDVDKESIEYARAKYPQIDFQVGNALDCAGLYNQPFDIIYLFNVFYALNDKQEVSLKEFAKLAKPTTTLILFDYTNLSGEKNASDFMLSRTPINEQALREMTSNTGWFIDHSVDLTEHYLRWYRNLVEKIRLKQKEIVNMAGESWFEFAKKNYEEQVADIDQGVLGGGIFYLRPNPL